MRVLIGMSAIGRLLLQLAVIGCFLGQLSADVDLGKNYHPEFYFKQNLVLSLFKSLNRAEILCFKSCTH
jgi:hypothetical protein